MTSASPRVLNDFILHFDLLSVCICLAWRLYRGQRAALRNQVLSFHHQDWGQISGPQPLQQQTLLPMVPCRQPKCMKWFFLSIYKLTKYWSFYSKGKYLLSCIILSNDPLGEFITCLFYFLKIFLLEKFYFNPQ